MLVFFTFFSMHLSLRDLFILFSWKLFLSFYHFYIPSMKQRSGNPFVWCCKSWKIHFHFLPTVFNTVESSFRIRPRYSNRFTLFLNFSPKGSHLERKVQFFLTLFKRGGGVKPMFKNYVVNFVVFWQHKLRHRKDV